MFHNTISFVLIAEIIPISVNSARFNSCAILFEFTEIGIISAINTNL
jgi:hypothetical protein